VFRDAWANRGKMGDSTLMQQQREFLPGALEITQSPPSPIGRTIIWVLIALFTIAIIWACLGKVNIVAVAEGKIVPSSQVKQIQPLERGVITKILVQEGDKVKAGTPLVELDRTLTEADQQRLIKDLTTQRLTASRMQQLSDWLQQGDHSKPCLLPESDLGGAPDERRYIQARLLEQKCMDHRAQVAALDNQLRSRQAEFQANRALITKLDTTLPLITKRATALKTLLDKQLGSEQEYLQLEQQRIEAQQDLAAAQARGKQLLSAIGETEQQLLALNAQANSRVLEQLSNTQREIDGLMEELNKAQDLNAKQILYSPVDGTVQQLVVNTVGGVVEPAQVLMLVVPSEEKLLVEAMLENKDIGFVRTGQEAEIKVHTFPFTKYGVIEAQVLNVSSDAIATEQQGLIYKVKLLMNKSTLVVDHQEVQLIPGMAVTAEVMTGERRLIEYVMAPLMRYKQESVRER
jgi:hemolysin D